MADPPPLPRRGGPRTPEGKARTALNATRHGLRARHFRLLPHEDPAEFEALAQATREAYRPRCPVERELVEAIAVALWRAIRVDRIEAEALADIPPADDSRSCGSDFLEERHRASLALVLRYRAQAEAGVRRAQDALARHRRLSAGAAALTAELAAEVRAAPPLPCTNELGARPPAEAAETAIASAEARDPACTNEPAAEPLVADPLPASEAAPVRLELREAVRRERNPLDTRLLRALGRDPDLVLPVPGLRPEAWPIAQQHAVPDAPGLAPYRRVPHLPWGEWYAHQHLLAEMERAGGHGGAPPEPARAA